MRVFQKIESYSGAQPVVLSIGNFDGLHRGHQYLLQKNLDLATKKGAKSVVLSFKPHPMQVLKKEAFSSLSTPMEQEELLEKIGVDEWIIEPFTPQMREESADSFMARLMKYVPLCGIVVGPDFHFGKNRQGDVNFLKAVGLRENFEVLIPEPYFDRGQRVSSSQIRSLLQQGDLDIATEFLGRPFSIQGKVISGFHRGAKLGFPTANISSALAKNLRRGSYITEVLALGGRWKAATNVGLHPTFGEEEELKIESHLLDFNQNLYGEDIKIEFLRFLRSEKKFESIEDLIAQIEKDIRAVRDY